MKKIIVKLDLHDNKDKRKALKAVSTLRGIDSIAMDMKEMKMTVIGAVDPVDIVSKLRKFWPADMVSVGPAKEPEKPAEPKKEEPKKEEPKKEEEAKKEEEPKKEEAKKEEPKKEEAKKEGEPKKEEAKKEEEPKKEEAEKKKEPTITEFVNAYRGYYPYYTTQPHYNNQYYSVRSMEENPNSCAIL